VPTNGARLCRRPAAATSEHQALNSPFGAECKVPLSRSDWGNKPGITSPEACPNKFFAPRQGRRMATDRPILKNHFRLEFRRKRTGEIAAFEHIDIAAAGLRHSRAPFGSERGALARITVKPSGEIRWFFRAAGGFTLMRHKCRAPLESERDWAESQSQGPTKEGRGEGEECWKIYKRCKCCAPFPLTLNPSPLGRGKCVIPPTQCLVPWQQRDRTRDPSFYFSTSQS
jgi:hypothetical protein